MSTWRRALHSLFLAVFLPYLYFVHPSGLFWGIWVIGITVLSSVLFVLGLVIGLGELLERQSQSSRR